jgi:hypothetical protein
VVIDELGLKPTDEEFDILESLARTGKWEKLDKKIEAIRVKKAEPEKEQPKETEDERLEKRLKEELEKRGLLTPETGTPSSSSLKSLAEVAKDYQDGKVSRKVYEEAKEKAGI